ncbi:MAG: hypothetical protein OES79_13710, partial [Planctomycetota bacterium]|nr:hypothetical protein [Planctomycetota bacterium]
MSVGPQHTRQQDSAEKKDQALQLGYGQVAQHDVAVGPQVFDEESYKRVYADAENGKQPISKSSPGKSPEDEQYDKE